MIYIYIVTATTRSSSIVSQRQKQARTCKVWLYLAPVCLVPISGRIDFCLHRT